MANSRYEYTRKFEADDSLLPETWIVIRIDGRGFHKLSSKYEFHKPNDGRALGLMNAAARAVLHEIPDLVLAYGQSDEYSFVFRKNTKFFGRRASKLATTVVSVFTAHYILNWQLIFPDKRLSSPLPSFDGRAIVYPSEETLRDYLSWRQVDCHINNLYNTTFWALVHKGGCSEKQATEELKHTLSSDKNDILHSRFGINYNNELELYRRGTTVIRSDKDGSKETHRGLHNTESAVGDKVPEPDSSVANEHGDSSYGKKNLEELDQEDSIVALHVDIIKDAFWLERPWILADPKAKRERKKALARAT